MTDRIIFAAVIAIGLPAIAYSIGIEHGEAKSTRVCQQHPGERLVSTEQRPGVTICSYASEPRGYGMEKRKRKAL